MVFLKADVAYNKKNWWHMRVTLLGEEIKALKDHSPFRNVSNTKSAPVQWMRTPLPYMTHVLKPKKMP